LFEDEHLIAVLKPAGLLSAPTPESDRNNLVSVLSHRATPPERLFVVHRLDLHTSGVLVVARTEAANQRLSEVFRVHDLTRAYETWVDGHVSESAFTVSTPVGGKSATTHFRVLARLSCAEHALTHMEAILETGRTHQIRIHAASIGHPVLADLKYGRRDTWHPERLALHAKRLALTHPLTGQPLELTAPTPADLEGWLEKIVNPDTPS
jgi:23S rRNA pseudouridine1911/1915/1917 synthase